MLRPEKLYFSDRFLVSAGTVLLRRKPPSSTSGFQVCLIHDTSRSLWHLPKGRKDQGETIDVAAVRETCEETGYDCELVPIRMSTRAPIPGVNTLDMVSVVDGLTEPIAVTVRDVGAEKGVKFIWWYLSRLKDSKAGKVEKTKGENEIAWEAGYESHFVDIEQAVERVQYQTEKDVVRRVLDLLTDNPSVIIP